VRWFGPTWGAPVNEDVGETTVPVGVACERCGLEIGESDRGVALPVMRFPGEVEPVRLVIGGHEHVAYHLLCFLSSVLGEEKAQATVRLLP
jgi:hypothetical protein